MIALSGLPTLATERLTLRAPQASDWPTFREFAMSSRTAFVGGAKTQDKAAEKFAAFFGHWVMRGFGRLIAEDRATGLALGHFGPMQWLDGGPIELTWSLWRPEAEGRGFATEAARAMTEWTFAALGLTAAHAEVHRDNAASHAIAQKLGGQVIAGQKPIWFEDGAVYHFTAGHFAAGGAL